LRTFECRSFAVLPSGAHEKYALIGPSADPTTELIRLIPSFLWVALVLIVVLLFRPAIRKELLPRLTRVRGFGFELEAAAVVKQELDRVADIVPSGTETTRTQVARRAARSAPLLQGARVLLVNDRPDEMAHATRLLQSLGLDVEVVTSTTTALENLNCTEYDVVISDMARDEIPDEGLRFLTEARRRGIAKPTIFTVGS
jgi:hypothetical protein